MQQSLACKVCFTFDVIFFFKKTKKNIQSIIFSSLVTYIKIVYVFLIVLLQKRLFDIEENSQIYEVKERIWSHGRYKCCYNLYEIITTTVTPKTESANEGHNVATTGHKCEH